MKKLFRHKWKLIGFLKWHCIYCGCIKDRELKKLNENQTFYFDQYVRPLSGLPECKRIMHCDKVLT